MYIYIKILHLQRIKKRCLANSATIFKYVFLEMTQSPAEQETVAKPSREQHSEKLISYIFCFLLALEKKKIRRKEKFF